MAMRVSSPPSAAWRASSSASVSSVTALATSRPPARKRVNRRVEHARIAGAAADEDRVRRRQPGKRGRRHAFDDLEAGHAEARRRCGGCAPARSARASIATARSDGSASIHSIADRARAGADVPEQLAAARRERRTA